MAAPAALISPMMPCVTFIGPESLSPSDKGMAPRPELAHRPCLDPFNWLGHRETVSTWARVRPLPGAKGGMIRHYVTHPFGRPLAVHRGKPLCSNPARRLTLSCRHQGICRAQDAKNRPPGRFVKHGAGLELTRALPCAHPVGSLRLSRRAILPSCRTRVQTEPFITGNAKGPVLRQALLRYLAVREG